MTSVIRYVLLSLLLTGAGFADINAQEKDSLTFEEVMAYDFDDLDTGSFLSLIDSLIKLEVEANKSSLITTLGYNSQLTSAGRELNLSQPGYNFSASYYHKSGIYGNAAMFLNEGYDRTHYLTTATVGYLSLLGKNWMYGVSFDRLFYHDGDSSYYHPLENSLNGGLYFQKSIINVDLDYSFYFGEENGHQVLPGLSLNFNLKNVWIIDRINFNPGITLLFGSNTITSIIPSPSSRLCRFRIFRRRNPERCFSIESEDSFGLLNHGISIPVQIFIEDFSIGGGYHYNIPRTLEGDRNELDPYSYYRAWASYTFRY